MDKIEKENMDYNYAVIGQFIFSFIEYNILSIFFYNILLNIIYIHRVVYFAYILDSGYIL